MQTVNHIGFIVAAYAATIVAIAGLTAWVMVDYRVLRRRLIALDAQGIVRRSAVRPAAEPAQPDRQATREEA
jgi:heme exporter protein D